jgi:hypothetical protein
MHLSELSTLFDITEGTVRRELARGPEDLPPVGRDRPLDADIELLDAFQRGEPMTNKELLQNVRAVEFQAHKKQGVFIHRAAS